MLSRSALVLALAGSTAAFSPMSMSLDRRTIVQAGAVVAPLLRPGAANAGLSSLSDGSKTVGGSAPAAKGGKGGKGMDKSGRAPDILIMDHRGCSRSRRLQVLAAVPLPHQRHASLTVLRRPVPLDLLERLDDRSSDEDRDRDADRHRDAKEDERLRDEDDEARAREPARELDHLRSRLGCERA